MKQARKDAIDELWSLLFVTFDSTVNNKNMRNITPFQGPTNDVQNRMVQQLARLKSGRSDDSDATHSIEADLHICNATGWMTDETYQKSLDLLEEVKNGIRSN